MTAIAEPEPPRPGADLISQHWATRTTPFIAAKIAVTLDGRSATRTGDSQWITGAGARADVMRWRRLFPAIAVGAGTVRADNPRLTARLAGQPEWCPTRFVFDGRLSTAAGPALPQVYTDEFRARTIVVTTPRGGNEARGRLQAQGVQVWEFPAPEARVPLADFRARCAEVGIHGVYLEGGANLLGHFLQARQLDYLFVYTAPLLFADAEARPAFHGWRTEKIAGALRLEHVQHETFGADRLMRGRVVYPANG
jgi:diaminohydroxyphosphoribosylaminopyrimidine deaminase/5-amino-6-(5-phosphoribosylamino)uracil reductase